MASGAPHIPPSQLSFLSRVFGLLCFRVWVGWWVGGDLVTGLLVVLGMLLGLLVCWLVHWLSDDEQLSLEREVSC